MTENDDETFAGLIALLGEAFISVEDKKAELYFKMLKDKTIQEIEAGVKTIIRTRTTATFPKVAEILTAIEGSVEDKAQAALGSLEMALHKHGHYDTVIFDDKIIHMAVQRLGGWIDIYEKWADLRQWEFSKRDFIHIYGTLSKHPSASYPAKLIGQGEIDNQRYPEHIPKPILIGAEQKLIKGMGRVGPQLGRRWVVDRSLRGLF